MVQPTLLKELEQLLYTHAQNMPYKKHILALVGAWEEAYLQRIAELEKADNAGNRMESEGAPARSNDSRFDPDEHFDDDLRGTRYDDLE